METVIVVNGVTYTSGMEWGYIRKLDIKSYYAVLDSSRTVVEGFCPAEFGAPEGYELDPVLQAYCEVG